MMRQTSLHEHRHMQRFSVFCTLSTSIKLASLYDDVNYYNSSLLYLICDTLIRDRSLISFITNFKDLKKSFYFVCSIYAYCMHKAVEMLPQLTLDSSEAYFVDDSQSVSVSLHITEPLSAYLLWTKKGTHIIWSPEFQEEFEDWWNKNTVWDQDTHNKVIQHKCKEVIYSWVL